MPRQPKLQMCPFEILIDSNEQAPWDFGNFKRRNKPLIIETHTVPLWNHERRHVTSYNGDTFLVGLADYSIKGHEFAIQIERKSVSDLYSTLGERRDKFECEIARLNEDVERSAVIVEGSAMQVMSHEGHGPKPASVMGTIFGWGERYRNVHWHLCVSRQQAAEKCLRMFEQYWKDYERGWTRAKQDDA